MGNVAHSTIRALPDGSVTRWNPIVGRWAVETAAARQVSAGTPAAQPVAEVRSAGSTAQHAPSGNRRMYASARSTRLTQGFGSSGNSSADAELHTSLSAMRARSRQMVRDSSYAKRAKRIVVDNIIGSGVGMQAQVATTRGELNDRVNSDIETEFAAWAAASSCHTGGKLHLADLERAAVGQIFEAGEVLVRMHYARFGDSKVPLALELIEAERLAHEMVSPAALGTNADVRMGIEADRFGRPVAYWIRQQHPGDLRARTGESDRYERVPASEVHHLYIVERWPQSRGEPWLHTALRKLDEMNEYTGYEVSAARGSAAYFATITTPESQNPLVDEEEEDGSQVMDLEPLTIQALRPGESLDFHAPNRPNPGMDPFMRAMLREVAAGAGTSYESLSRDYSQSNYSSSRLALLDDRELYKVVQQWWVRTFRLPLHRKWLQQAVLAGAVQSVSVTSYATAIAKYEAVLFKPRGWSWIDPTKEVAAYKEAIKGGLTTLSDVIAATGGGQDIEDFIKTRQRELKLLAAAGIQVDTTVTAPVAPTPAPAPKVDADEEPSEGDEADGAGGKTAQRRVVSLANARSLP